MCFLRLQATPKSVYINLKVLPSGHLFPITNPCSNFFAQDHFGPLFLCSASSYLPTQPSGRPKREEMAFGQVRHPPQMLAFGVKPALLCIHLVSRLLA